MTSGHRKLDPLRNEIRLLVLQPSKDSEAQIECYRETVSLNDNPEFEALSYAWGNPNLVDSVLVDNKAFSVTLNASSALKALRYGDRARVLWIDAICIDQLNLEERAAQVKMMGTIYRMASCVRVWLGSDDDEDIYAIPVLKSMTSAQGVEDTFGYKDSAKSRVEQVKRFFARAWWERIWVVQEVALGKHVILQQGVNELKYEDLIAAYNLSNSAFNESLNGHEYGNYGSGGYDLMETFKSAHMLSQIRDVCAGGEDEESSVRERTMAWLTVANMLRSRKATVERDRLYALFGLLPQRVLQSPSMDPSYLGTTEEAFVEATYGIIESSKSFMVFNFLHRNSDSKASAELLPSWVPDWRLGPSNEHEGSLRVVRERLFDASKSTPFYLRRLSSNTICLKGFLVDVVHVWQHIAIVPATSAFLDACHNKWREMWANTDPNNAMLRNYLDGTDAETAFRRTMVWDCELGPEEGTLKRLTQAEGLAMFDAHDRAVTIGHGDDWDIAGQHLSAMDARRTNYMINCVKGRTFFVTATGLIGITQANVEAGDYIFIVAGSSHPIILRPSKRYAATWQAVAECYLHAFMDGNGVSNIEICAKVEDMLSNIASLKNLKGAERNPRQDEITEEPNGLWKWLLVE